MLCRVALRTQIVKQLIFSSLSLFQVSRRFWIESLNEVNPVSKGALKPDREVKLGFVDR